MIDIALHEGEQMDVQRFRQAAQKMEDAVLGGRLGRGVVPAGF